MKTIKNSKVLGKNILSILLNAAQMASSAGNVQGRDYIIVTDQIINNWPKHLLTKNL